MIFQRLFIKWPLTFFLNHRKNLIRVDEVLDAMRKFGKVSDEEKLQRIADVLDEDHDGAIRVQDVLKVSSRHIKVTVHKCFNNCYWQGCQLWMRVRREICEARPLAAYICRASPKKADERGGGRLSLFFFLKNFGSHFHRSRHIVGVPFVHHKPLTSKKKIVWDISIRYAWEREIQVKWGEMRESHAQCVRVGSPGYWYQFFEGCKCQFIHYTYHKLLKMHDG